MANGPAIGILSAAELAVILGPVVQAFTAEARLTRDRGDAVRQATAGFESGRVIPAVAELFREVEERRTEIGTLEDALSRGDLSLNLSNVLEAGAAAGRPSRLLRRTIQGWTVLAWSLIASLGLAWVALWSLLAEREVGPAIIAPASRFALAGGLAVSLGAAFAVRNFNRSLERSIREGRDAAR